MWFWAVAAMIGSEVKSSVLPDPRLWQCRPLQGTRGFNHVLQQRDSLDSGARRPRTYG